ncbi:MAG: radical SAM family heme chaperone HemW [Pseudomonadota bacterium]
MGRQADWQAGGFGLYIHWPFCQAKCPYCDFNSHVTKTTPDHQGWAAALRSEMQAMRRLTGPRRLDTIFFGGGTPSLMAPATVDALIAEADRLWGLAPEPEITLEANPTSVEAEQFRAFAAGGVNRVSVGVQALDDASLRALGRLHSADEARRALAIARETFKRVSFDLIYTRMGQTPEAWCQELDAALAMAADHLSLYQLTIEPGTRFAELHARGRLSVPAPEPSAAMYEITQTLTAAAGLPAYEVSNHAVPGAESRHNLVYWRYGDYAGIGPGAHGRLTLQDGRRMATESLADPAEWLTAARRAQPGGKDASGAHRFTEVLDREAQGDEMMLMGLRLAEGVEPARFERLTGRPLPAERIAALQTDGLLALQDTPAGPRLAATARGRIVLNALLAELLA